MIELAKDTVVGQLFVRKSAIDGMYIVCGLIIPPNELKDGTLLTISTDSVKVHLEEDIHESTRGLGLDNVLTEPFWRLNPNLIKAKNS